MYRLLLAIVALIVYGSLYPWRFDFGPGHPDPLLFLLHSGMPAWDRFMLRDAAVNVALYFPLGAVAALAFVRRHSRAAALGGALLLGLLLSAGMEMLQVYVPGRDTSLADVSYNFCGTAAGALAALVFRRDIEAAWAARKWGRQGAAAALLLACWAGYQLYPLIPQLSRSRLRMEAAALIHGDAVSPVAVWAGAAEWFAVAAILSALAGAVRTRWLAAAMLCLPLRLLVIDRRLSLEDVLAAGVGLLLWSAFRNRAVRAGTWLLGSAIVVRGLAPFHFRAAAWHFSWIPFAASFASERRVAAIILFRKAFDYGAAVWLLRAAGMRYALAGAAVAAVLGAIEWIQRYLPGRTPEITDPLLALAMAFALWKLSDSGKRRGLG